MSQRQGVNLRELADFPAALPDASFGVRRLVNRLLIRSGVELKLLVTTNSILTTTSIARQGVAYTLMPRFAVARDCEAKSLIAIPIEGLNLEPARVEITVHGSRHLPIAAREFLSTLVRREPARMPGGVA